MSLSVDTPQSACAVDPRLFLIEDPWFSVRANVPLNTEVTLRASFLALIFLITISQGALRTNVAANCLPLRTNGLRIPPHSIRDWRIHLTNYCHLTLAAVGWDDWILSCFSRRCC